MAKPSPRLPKWLQDRTFRICFMHDLFGLALYPMMLRVTVPVSPVGIIVPVAATVALVTLIKWGGLS